MKYDARACHFNMDTGCVELLLRDGRMISINCTGVEDALDVTMAQRFELDYLIYNEQVVRSNRISSSKVKSPKSGFSPSFSGIFVWLGKCLSRGMWALITPISRKVLKKGGSRGGAKRGEKQGRQPELAQDFLR